MRSFRLGQRAALRAAAKRPIIAYHVIFTAYGFWLPNDPRGSWTDFVGSWELFRYGAATKTDTRRSVASTPHDRESRMQAKQALKYPPVKFDGYQALQIAKGFAHMVEKSACVFYACAILPDHVHLVLAKHRYKVEQMVNLLKGEASRALSEARMHPMAAWSKTGCRLATPWAHRCWKVYLHTAEEVARAIQYVEANPVKEGKRPQKWSFITPFVPA
jgi:REP element-mobilizing transposase RayT